MNNQSILEIVIKAKDEATSQLKNIEGSLKNMEGAFTTMRNVGVGAFVAIGGVAVTSLKAYSEAQADMAVATQGLNNTLENMSSGALNKLQRQAGEGADVFEYMAESMNKAGSAAVQMGFDDEAASQSFARLFATTKDNTQAQKELQIAMDLARYKNISLEDATQKLMMVHSGATKELKSLGIAVTDGASAMQNLDSIQKQVTGSAETYAKTTAGAMDVLNVQFGNIQETIGEALAPALTELFAKLTPIINKIVDWITNNKELVANILLVGGAVAGIIAVIGTLGLVLPSIIAGVTALGTVLAFIISPIGLVVVAIAALVAAIIYCVTHWDIIKAKVIEVWEFIKAYIANAVDAIGARIKAWVSGVYSSVVGVFSLVKSEVVGIWEAIKSSIFGVIDSIMSRIQAMVDSVRNAYAAASSFVGGAISSTASLFSGKRANGGPVSAGNSYLVGENGPELFTPNSTGAVIPNNGFGGANITLNITGNSFLGDDDVADKIGAAIMRSLQFQLKF